MNGLLIQWGYHQENGPLGRTIEFIPSFNVRPIMSVTQLFDVRSNNEEVIIRTVSKERFFYDSTYNRDIFWIAIGY